MAGSVPKRGLRRFTRRSARAPLRSHCHRGQVVPPQRSRRAFGSQPAPAPSAQTAKVGHLHHRGPPLFPRGGPNCQYAYSSATRRSFVQPNNFAEYAPFYSAANKKGKLSVGVAHQYCGQLGKQANCQVAVSLSIANSFASLPVAYQLYMPQAWLEDEHADKRKKCKVPVDIAFRTKPQIALQQISEALEADVPRGVVLADAAYGNNTAFRTGLTALSVQYSVNIQESTTAWPDGQAPLKPPRRRSKRGRKPIRIRHTRRRHPVRVRDIAHALPESAYKRVSWREGTAKPLTSRFAATRVRPASGDTALSAPREYEWLLIEWPKDEQAPTKYWLSTMSEATPLVDLVTTSMLRWRIERDYQNLKQELGLGQYEGRSSQGFHHHATVCIAAYGFLLITQGGFSPGAVLVSDSRNLPYPTVSGHAALPVRCSLLCVKY